MTPARDEIVAGKVLPGEATGSLVVEDLEAQSFEEKEKASASPLRHARRSKEPVTAEEDSVLFSDMSASLTRQLRRESKERIGGMVAEAEELDE